MTPALVQRRAFTLVELVVSITILGVLLLATQSALTLARKLGDNSSLAATGTAVAMIDQLAAFASTSLAISTPSATSVSLTVADVTGDGADDTLVYSWNGSPGGPLTLVINGSAAATVVPAVESVAFSLATAPRSFPTVPVPASQLPPAEFSLRPCTTTVRAATVVTAFSATVRLTGEPKAILVNVGTLNMPEVK